MGYQVMARSQGPQPGLACSSQVHYGLVKAGGSQLPPLRPASGGGYCRRFNRTKWRDHYVLILHGYPAATGLFVGALSV